MNYAYQVKVTALKEVHEIPGAWTNDDLHQVLHTIEYEDADSIAPEELKEMTAMALSDLEPVEAAVVLLEQRFGDQLSKGQCQNIAGELKDDRLWEEYAEISYHEELFNVAHLLHQAFPKVFPEPDIVQIILQVTAVNPGSSGNLQSPDASFVARLLNDGMNDHNAMYRLFDEQIASNTFPEAEDIIWKFEAAPFNEADQSSTLTIYTSWNWVDELKGVREFESTAFKDGQLK